MGKNGSLVIFRHPQEWFRVLGFRVWGFRVSGFRGLGF